MRIIGGILRGRRLVSPAGKATRPTADRIRESIFNILAGTLQDQRVLDLFAGTGALGIEALSRGAVSAVFVDQAKASLAAIQRNLRDLGLQDRAQVIQWNILKNLNCLLQSGHAFDLVFMDPPYEKDAVGPALAALGSCGALASGARVVIEHSHREPIIQPLTGGFVLVDQRRFGRTLVSFIHTVI